MDCRAFLLNDKVFQKLDCHPQLTIFPKMDCRASSSTTIFPRLDCHLWQSFQAWIVVLLLCLAIFSKFGLSSLASFPRLDCHTPSSLWQNFPKDCRRSLLIINFGKSSSTWIVIHFSKWQIFPKWIVGRLFFANVPRRGLSIVAIFSQKDCRIALANFQGGLLSRVIFQDVDCRS